MRTIAAGLLCSLLVVASAEAKVSRFVVEQRRPFAGGATFGDTGAYERLDGTVYFEIDPNDPHNRLIVNLNRAPRNARGLVELSSPFFLLKPVYDFLYVLPRSLHLLLVCGGDV